MVAKLRMINLDLSANFIKNLLTGAGRNVRTTHINVQRLSAPILYIDQGKLDECQ